MGNKVWFITGTSRGFGREWAIAALERGDKVAATARDTATLDDLAAKYGDALLPIQLDVTDRDADFAAVKQAHDHFGRLDIVVNNAGYGHFGFIEELTEAEARAQIETNVFGALWVTQAALPFLRAQRSGHIIQVSSIGGITAFQNVGIYHASKWALEGFSQALAQEVAPFGIHVTLIEPGGVLHRLGRVVVEAVDAAARLQGGARGGRARRAASASSTPGDPRASARGRAQDRRRCRAAAAGVLRRGAAAAGQGRLREPAQDVGSSGSRSPSRRRADQAALRLPEADDVLVVAEQLVADRRPGAAQHAATRGDRVALPFGDQMVDGFAELGLEARRPAAAGRCGRAPRDRAVRLRRAR